MARKRASSAPSPLRYGQQIIDAADRAAVDRALRSDWLTQGPEVASFEAALARACGAKYAVACANGTAALHLACLAAGLKPGDEAIVPAITFAATANAALYCGAEPVITDIRPDTLTLDPGAARKALSRRTKAILPVHFAGLPAAMEDIARMARSHGLVVIADGAHALGARYDGKPVGAFPGADMTTLSFHPVKHVTTGEGGAVLTDRSDLRDRLLSYRSHGITRDPLLLEDASQGGWYYEMQALGFNYRISDFQCALGTSQLRKLPRFLERRHAAARAYERAFSSDARIKLQASPAGRVSARHLFTIQVPAERRRALYDYLHSQGILANVHYIPVHLLPFYQRRGWKGRSLPNAETYYAGALSLPMHAALTDADLRRVIKAVRDGLKD